MKLATVAAFAVVDGARVSRKKHSTQAEDFIVLFKDGTTDSDIQEFCGGKCGLVGHPSSGGVAFAQVHGGSEMQAMFQAQADKVELYEPDSTDYMIPELESSEAASSVASWGLERVGVPSRALTGRGQTIYVQDTGVRFTHRDFGGRAFAGLDLTTNRGVEVCDRASLTCSVDRQGHGTHCAGSAAGTTFGVASDATIYSLKTLSDRGSGARSWQMAAIDWVTANGVRPSIISMSLGGSGRDSAYTKAIGAATAAGITVVVAAGNSNSDSCNFSPAFAVDAITVGSTDSRNQRSSFSNFGTCNNIMAPGSAITSASVRSDTGSSTQSGTSMACPHVSGAAALLLEADSSLNRDQILAQLKDVSRRGLIDGLRRNDPEEFLWVGAQAPQAEDFIVLFKDGATDSDIQEFCGGRCGLVGHPSSGGVAFAQVHGGSEMQAMYLAKADKVELYERDGTDYMIPELESSEAAASVASWGLERVGVPSRALTGRGQTIYVQDTGVRFTHRDFGGRAFAGLDLTSNRGVEVCDRASMTCSVDRQGHGTHCAGTAAGTTFGVASDATIYSLKTLSDQGSGARSWQMAAIDWVTANGVRPSIISMSLGGSGRDSAYTKAIGAATAAGITVVVAAGNSNSDACNFSPAFAVDAITVGSTDSRNQRSSFSNFGSCNNIMAPGSAITSASVRSDTRSSTQSGTSMACPHVSGAAALLLQANSRLNRDQILAQLKDVSRRGLIEGLRRNDPEEFLWVGA